MDLSKVFKGSLVRVIAELRSLVPKEEFDAAVKKVIPEGLDGIENFKYEPVETKKDDAKSKTKKQRVFDITKYRRRHIALRIYYDGSQMGGFAQHDSCSLMDGMADDNSVETAIFTALKRVNLIDDITKCRYHRCGRTDAGVSAFNQVISLYLRSNLRSGVEFVDEYDPAIVYNPPATLPKTSLTEFDYPAVELRFLPHGQVLNKVLPPNIRVTGWCPVSRSFSARFSCCGRVYRYYFLRREYDTDLLKQAVKLLEGEHDFRNFCRIDAVNVCDFTRTIFRGDVVLVEKGRDPSHDVMAVEIIGRAFLWHQIRCIMSILFLIGSKSEPLSVIPALLDVSKCPHKPQYLMADPEPLVLYDCIFTPRSDARDSSTRRFFETIRASPFYAPIVESNTEGKYNCEPCSFDESLSPAALRELVSFGESQLFDCAVRRARVQQMLDGVCDEYEERVAAMPRKRADFRELLSLKYTPLGKRTKAPSYEERILTMGNTSLAKLQNRYQNVDLEKNAFIPEVIKKKLAEVKK